MSPAANAVTAIVSVRTAATDAALKFLKMFLFHLPVFMMFLLLSL